MATAAEPATATKPTALPWAGALLLLSLVGMAGSLFLSIHLGLKACPLCFYQRTLIMAIFAVLCVGLALDRARAGLLCLLSLPLAFGGLGVAGFHEYLVMTDKLECPNGLLDLGSVPAQSLTIFVILTSVCALGAWTGSDVFPATRRIAVVGAAFLGLLVAWGSVASAPPMPPAPKQAYDPVKQPLDMFRPPFRSP